MEEKVVRPISGYVILLVVLVMISAIIYFALGDQFLWAFVIAVLTLFTMIGFFFIYPNGSRVLTLFGDYKGTVKDNGFFCRGAGCD